MPRLPIASTSSFEFLGWTVCCCGTGVSAPGCPAAGVAAGAALGSGGGGGGGASCPIGIGPVWLVCPVCGVAFGFWLPVCCPCCCVVCPDCPEAPCCPCCVVEDPCDWL